VTLRPNPNCAECGGRGFVDDPAGPYACSCLTSYRGAWTDDDARIPIKYRTRSFESFKVFSSVHESARGQVQAYVERLKRDIVQNERNGLLLTGRAGSGKTHLAVAALRGLIAGGRSGLMWNVNDLFRALREAVSRGEGESDLVDDVRESPVLLLDDLCAEKSTEYVQDRLYAIINGRYEQLLPTIVTTNETLDGLREALGRRLASRLWEMCQHIQMPEEDYRALALQGR